MTTIACNGKTIAADSRATFEGSGEIVFEAGYKVHVEPHVVIAVSGHTDIAPAVVKWASTFADGRPPTHLRRNKAEWECLRISTRGLEYHSNDTLDWTKHTFPFAIGSGYQYALGAMLAGASSKKAVEIAAIKDSATGGMIHVWRLPRLVVNPHD